MNGVPNSACLVEDPNASAASEVSSQSLTLASGKRFTTKIWVKKDNDETRFPEFSFDSGTHRYFVQLNTQTGASAVRFDSGGVGNAHEVVDDGDWWVMILTAENWPGATYGFKIWPAKGATLGGNNSNATGSIIVGNAEVYENKTIAEVRDLGPIFTTSAEASTDRTAYSFDLGNMDLDIGAMYGEVAHGIGSNNPEDLNIGLCAVAMDWSDRVWVVSSGGTGGDFGSMNTTSSAGTITSSSISIIPRDAETKVATVWSNSDSLAQVNLEGNTAEGAFSTYRSRMGNLRLFEIASTDTYSGKMRDLQRYDIPDYQTGKDIIDGLMT